MATTILRVAGGAFKLAGGIMAIKGTRQAIKGMYYEAYGALSQSQEAEYVSRYNAEVVEMDANARGKAMEFNADIRKDYIDHEISEIKLGQNNAGVEMSGSPLLAISKAVDIAQEDLHEANRESDIVRKEGRAQRSLLERSADIEKINRGQMILGYKNKISGAQWGMAGQGMNTIAGALGS